MPVAAYIINFSYRYDSYIRVHDVLIIPRNDFLNFYLNSSVHILFMHRYYEEKTSRVEETMMRETQELSERALAAEEANKEQEARAAALTKEKAKCEQKLHQLSNKVLKINNELSEERQINESLRKNQAEWEARFSKMEEDYRRKEEVMGKEMEDLKVTFFS